MSGFYKGQAIINLPLFVDFQFFMKKITGFIPFLLLLVGLLYQSSCYFDNLQELHPELLLNNNCDTTATMSYQTHIKPILSNSCGANNSCHNAQAASSGVVLENYSGVKSAINGGKFMSSILWDGNSIQMPKDSPSKINDCSIMQLQKWIDAGALNN